MRNVPSRRPSPGIVIGHFFVGLIYHSVVPSVDPSGVCLQAMAASAPPYIFSVSCC